MISKIQHLVLEMQLILDIHILDKVHHSLLSAPSLDKALGRVVVEASFVNLSSFALFLKMQIAMTILDEDDLIYRIVACNVCSGKGIP